MYDSKKFRSAQNVTDVSFFVVWGILMLIMLVTRLVSSPLQEHVTFLDNRLSVGLQRSRTVYHSPLLKLYTLLLDRAVLSFYG